MDTNDLIRWMREQNLVKFEKAPDGLTTSYGSEHKGSKQDKPTPQIPYGEEEYNKNNIYNAMLSGNKEIHPGEKHYFYKRPLNISNLEGKKQLTDATERAELPDIGGGVVYNPSVGGKYGSVLVGGPTKPKRSSGASAAASLDPRFNAEDEAHHHIYLHKKHEHSDPELVNYLTKIITGNSASDRVVQSRFRKDILPNIQGGNTEETNKQIKSLLNDIRVKGINNKGAVMGEGEDTIHPITRQAISNIREDKDRPEYSQNYSDRAYNYTKIQPSHFNKTKLHRRASAVFDSEIGDMHSHASKALEHISTIDNLIKNGEVGPIAPLKDHGLLDKETNMLNPNNLNKIRIDRATSHMGRYMNTVSTSLTKKMEAYVNKNISKMKGLGLVTEGKEGLTFEPDDIAKYVKQQMEEGSVPAKSPLRTLYKDIAEKENLQKIAYSLPRISSHVDNAHNSFETIHNLLQGGNDVLHTTFGHNKQHHILTNLNNGASLLLRHNGKDYDVLSGKDYGINGSRYNFDPYVTGANHGVQTNITGNEHRDYEIAARRVRDSLSPGRFETFELPSRSELFNRFYDEHLGGTNINRIPFSSLKTYTKENPTTQDSIDDSKTMLGSMDKDTQNVVAATVFHNLLQNSNERNKYSQDFDALKDFVKNPGANPEEGLNAAANILGKSGDHSIRHLYSTIEGLVTKPAHSDVISGDFENLLSSPDESGENFKTLQKKLSDLSEIDANEVSSLYGKNADIGKFDPDDPNNTSKVAALSKTIAAHAISNLENGDTYTDQLGSLNSSRSASASMENLSKLINNVFADYNIEVENPNAINEVKGNKNLTALWQLYHNVIAPHFESGEFKTPKNNKAAQSLQNIYLNTGVAAGEMSPGDSQHYNNVANRLKEISSGRKMRQTLLNYANAKLNGNEEGANSAKSEWRNQLFSARQDTERNRRHLAGLLFHRVPNSFKDPVSLEVAQELNQHHNTYNTKRLSDIMYAWDNHRPVTGEKLNEGEPEKTKLELLGDIVGQGNARNLRKYMRNHLMQSRDKDLSSNENAVLDPSELHQAVYTLICHKNPGGPRVVAGEPLASTYSRLFNIGGNKESAVGKSRQEVMHKIADYFTNVTQNSVGSISHRGVLRNATDMANKYKNNVFNFNSLAAADHGNHNNAKRLNNTINDFVHNVLHHNKEFDNFVSKTVHQQIQHMSNNSPVKQRFNNNLAQLEKEHGSASNNQHLYRLAYNATERGLQDDPESLNRLHEVFAGASQLDSQPAINALINHAKSEHLRSSLGYIEKPLFAHDKNGNLVNETGEPIKSGESPHITGYERVNANPDLLRDLNSLSSGMLSDKEKGAVLQSVGELLKAGGSRNDPRLISLLLNVAHQNGLGNIHDRNRYLQDNAIDKLTPIERVRPATGRISPYSLISPEHMHYDYKTGDAFSLGKKKYGYLPPEVMSENPYAQNERHISNKVYSTKHLLDQLARLQGIKYTDYDFLDPDTGEPYDKETAEKHAMNSLDTLMDVSHNVLGSQKYGLLKQKIMAGANSDQPFVDFNHLASAIKDYPANTQLMNSLNSGLSYNNFYDAGTRRAIADYVGKNPQSSAIMKTNANNILHGDAADLHNSVMSVLHQSKGVNRFDTSGLEKVLNGRAKDVLDTQKTRSRYLKDFNKLDKLGPNQKLNYLSTLPRGDDRAFDAFANGESRKELRRVLGRDFAGLSKDFKGSRFEPHLENLRSMAEELFNANPDSVLNNLVQKSMGQSVRRNALWTPEADKAIAEAGNIFNTNEIQNMREKLGFNPHGEEALSHVLMQKFHGLLQHLNGSDQPELQELGGQLGDAWHRVLSIHRGPLTSNDIFAMLSDTKTGGPASVIEQASTRLAHHQRPKMSELNLDENNKVHNVMKQAMLSHPTYGKALASDMPSLQHSDWHKMYHYLNDLEMPDSPDRQDVLERVRNIGSPATLGPAQMVLSRATKNLTTHILQRILGQMLSASDIRNYHEFAPQALNAKTAEDISGIGGGFLGLSKYKSNAPAHQEEPYATGYGSVGMPISSDNYNLPKDAGVADFKQEAVNHLAHYINNKHLSKSLDINALKHLINKYMMFRHGNEGDYFELAPTGEDSRVDRVIQMLADQLGEKHGS